MPETTAAEKPANRQPPHPSGREPSPHPADQRYEVLHHALGKWPAGTVIQADVDLPGVDVAGLLHLRAIAPTDKPRTGETGGPA